MSDTNHVRSKCTAMVVVVAVMARNEEKRFSALNRFLEGKREGAASKDCFL